MKKPDHNQGSAPLPAETLNRGDGLYREDESLTDKDLLKKKMTDNMAGSKDEEAARKDK